MSSDSTSAPVKETVYDGPDIELFKPKQPASSASRETVHVGEVPEHITRRYTSAELAQLPKPQTVTVHEGAIPEMFAKLGRIAHDLIMPDRKMSPISVRVCRELRLKSRLRKPYSTKQPS